MRTLQLREDDRLLLVAEAVDLGEQIEGRVDGVDVGGLDGRHARIMGEDLCYARSLAAAGCVTGPAG